MLTLLVVVARIVANPLSNLFQKQLAQRAAEPLFVIVATHGLLTVVALPLLIARSPQQRSRCCEAAPVPS